MRDYALSIDNACAIFKGPQVLIKEIILRPISNHRTYAKHVKTTGSDLHNMFSFLQVLYWSLKAK